MTELPLGLPRVAVKAKGRRGQSGRLGGSGYERRAFDAYFTEPAATRALVRALRRCATGHATDINLLSGLVPVWEPAAGRGDLAAVLAEAGAEVSCTDLVDHGLSPEAAGAGLSIDSGRDFLEAEPPALAGPFGRFAIVTNPPYGDLLQPFVAQALDLAIDAPRRRGHPGGTVAMLVNTMWTANNWTKGIQAELAGRDDLALKLELTWRLSWEWWEGAPKLSNGRENHCWLVWVAGHTGGARLAFGHRKG